MRRCNLKTVKASRADQQELKRLMSNERTQALFEMRIQKTLVYELCRKAQMTRVGVGYLCRRYEKIGLNAFYDASRSGCPREIIATLRALDWK